jgi:hypothetical protein
VHCVKVRLAIETLEQLLPGELPGDEIALQQYVIARMKRAGVPAEALYMVLGDALATIRDEMADGTPSGADALILPMSFQIETPRYGRAGLPEEILCQKE